MPGEIYGTPDELAKGIQNPFKPWVTPPQAADALREQELIKKIEEMKAKSAPPPLAGAKYDADKPQWALLPYDAINEIVKVLDYGAKKYAARNWEAGIAWSRVFSALMRHAWKWRQGENKDEETGISHLAHCGCCIVFLIAYELRGMKTFDDRPVGKEATNG